MSDPNFLPVVEGFLKTPLGGAVLGQLVAWFAQNLPQAEDPVLKAIDETVKLTLGEADPQAERLRSSLDNWVHSKSFQILLTSSNRLITPTTFAELLDSFENHGAQPISGLGLSAEEILAKFIPCLSAEFSLRDERYAAQSREFLKYDMTSLKDIAMQLVSTTERATLVTMNNAEKHIEEKIDSSKSLIEKGQIAGAKTLLLELRDDKNLTVNAHFRIALNLGVCALRKDEYDAAEQEFVIAKTLKSDSGIAWANLSQIEFLKDKFDSSLKSSEKAMELDGQNMIVVASYIMSLQGLRKRKEISVLIEQRPDILRDYSCLIVLGQGALGQKDFDDARSYFEKALSTADGQKNPQTYFLLAQSKSAKAQLSLQTDPPLPGALHHPVHKELEECIDLFSKAVEMLRELDDKVNLCKILVNRGGVKSLLGDTKGSLLDCDLALFHDASNPVALLNKARLLTLSGSLTEAETLLKRMPESHKSAARKILADVYFAEKRYDLAKEMFSAEQSSGDAIFEQIATGRLLEIEDLLGNREEVAKMMVAIESRHPNEPDYLYMIAQQLGRERRLPEQIAFLQKALATTNPQLKNWLNWELARAYFDISDFAKSVETYRLFVTDDSDAQHLIELAMSLHKSGEFYECARIAGLVRLRGKKIPQLMEAEAKAFVDQGKFDNALVLFNELVILNPQDPWYKIYVAQVLIEMQETERARVLLLEAEKQVLKADLYTEKVISKLLTRLPA